MKINFKNSEKGEVNIMFRFLSREEEANFRLWARDNYTPFTEISELWHPVVQDECRRMCEEKQA